MVFPIRLSCQVPELFSNKEITITLYDGLTVFVGPNGSGKSQLLRYLKTSRCLDPYVAAAGTTDPNLRDRRVRYIPAGRLVFLEQFRTLNQVGHAEPQFESATFGGKNVRSLEYVALETAQADFHALMARTDLRIKVTERLRKLFKRDILLEWDAGNLKVRFRRTDTASAYSSAREASGLLHLVSILAALYNDECDALLIDEPEISLHPQLQAFLRREIENITGDSISGQRKKLVVLATHSTSMINVQRPEDLSNIVFFVDATTPPLQVAPDRGELKNAGVQALLPRLGQSHRDAFFASRPVLVEGPSDEIICNYLDNRFELYLGTAGAQIVPVIGKGQMPAVSKLMRLIGKPPVILADLDSVTDDTTLVSLFNNEPNGRTIAEDAGHASLSDLARAVHSTFTQLVEKRWDDIEALVVGHPYWVNRDPDDDETKAKRRAALAILLTQPEENLPTHEEWRGIRRRYIALLQFLEGVGCFILRRGTIEDYYLSATTASEKPRRAVEETLNLASEEHSRIEERYDVLLRALRRASSTPTIDEAAAVRTLLGSVVGGVTMEMQMNTTNEELRSIAERVAQEQAVLFTLSNVSAGKAEPTLQVDLASTILDVDGFPIMVTAQNAHNEIRNRIKPATSPPQVAKADSKEQ